MKIHHRHTGAVIYEGEAALMAELVVEAVRLRADLSYAYLAGANLAGANLTGADLAGADLRYADLRYANLSNADFRYANLGEHLKGAQ